MEASSTLFLDRPIGTWSLRVRAGSPLKGTSVLPTENCSIPRISYGTGQGRFQFVKHVGPVVQLQILRPQHALGWCSDWSQNQAYIRARVS